MSRSYRPSPFHWRINRQANHWRRHTRRDKNYAEYDWQDAEEHDEDLRASGGWETPDPYDSPLENSEREYWKEDEDEDDEDDDDEEDDEEDEEENGS